MRERNFGICVAVLYTCVPGRISSRLTRFLILLTSRKRGAYNLPKPVGQTPTPKILDLRFQLISFSLSPLAIRRNLT